MKVLLVTHGFPPESLGGVEIQSAHLALALRARGIEVRVLAGRAGPRREHRSAVRTTYRGIALINLFQDPRRPLGPDELHDEALEEPFLQLVRDYAPDLVHIQHLRHLGLAVPGLLVREKIPFVISVHDQWWWCHRATRFLSNRTLCPGPSPDRCLACSHLDRDAANRNPAARGEAVLMFALRNLAAARALAAARRVIVPSHFAARELAERFSAICSGLAMIRYSIAPSRSDLPPRPDGTAPYTIGYMGTVDAHKGVHLLASAIARSRTTPRLAIWGGGGELYLREIEHLAGSVRPIFHGRYAPDRVPDILSHIDLLVVPSLWPESFGIVAAEARAFGVPVVAARIGGLPEAVGERGILFEPGDSAALAEIIDRYAETRRRAPHAHHESTLITPDEAAAQHARCYEEALQ